jgi:ribose 5-phosphate isomerase B
MMRIGIAVDHGGYALKHGIIEALHRDGHEVCDFGAYKYAPEDDFPDFVVPLAKSVAENEIERGIALCGSGVGACVAANKIIGVRAGVIWDCFSAHQGAEDDHMNMICFGARVIGPELARELTRIFLNAQPATNARFLRRLDKIALLEQGLERPGLNLAA